jgi:mersacidin/lichenicidin family type 2 lantibiotic
MSNATIVRAWKDAAFRATLAPGSVPDHPAGSGVVSRRWLEAESGSITTKSPRCSENIRCP